jgi:NAD(P)-dependent dehydrogenase (short-subunit alcohol dehydrogenase family)
VALEEAKEGIRVNCVGRGQVHSKTAAEQQQSLAREQWAAADALHPLGLGTPADVAYAVAFLLADTRRWITGRALVIDGGYTAQ